MQIDRHPNGGVGQEATETTATFAHDAIGELDMTQLIPVGKRTGKVQANRHAVLIVNSKAVGGIV